MTTVDSGPRHRADTDDTADASLDTAPAIAGGEPAAGGNRVPARSTDPTVPAGRSPGSGRRRADALDARTVAAAVGTSLALLGALLTGFVVYLFAFTAVQESHAQATSYKTFRNELALAVAPTGPVSAGRPVAILQVPGMDLHRSVVVEGTGPASLTRGPGHRADSPLPGQPGTSFIYARRETFGAPFAHFPRIRLGDVITVTTAQGVSRYRITSSGDSGHRLALPSQNALVLVTADSQTFPHHTLSVAGALIGQPFATGSTRPRLTAAERALGVDFSALQPLMMWSLALALVVALVTLMRQRWAKWPTYLCAVPVLLAVLWNVYENAAQLLPNVY